MAYLFVLIPLIAYLPLFLYETYASFKRLDITKRRKSDYLSATWEVTHTLLILAVTNFIWLFSDVIKAVGAAVYWGLIIVGAAFIVRAILYLYIFYIQDQTVRKKRASIFDYLFAASHLVILGGLIYTLTNAWATLSTETFTVNTEFIPYMWPGLILMIGICAIPIASIYRTKR